MQIDLRDSKLISNLSTAALFAKQNDTQPVLVAKVLGSPAYQSYRLVHLPAKAKGRKYYFCDCNCTLGRAITRKQTFNF